ncbi:Peptidase family M50 [Pelotomaculum sp. FP]|uniref:site-2 protease family protein n=1 Tax=Pelotomaculum sp. FP TaxID=261474 RepID=UPI0010660009|nr:site-2 protease family protein [Pelotomaculum sp. FP]TEB17479.1 Peptidase family M50 [Pelotomaculum sp. FP]
MFNFPSLHTIALTLPAIIIGLTFHEYAHGWVAYRLGDRTAEAHGRLTINPVAHLDPVGFILLLLAGFGWAKPVPVNPYNLRGDIKQGMLLVSLAGPATNFLLAVASAVILGLFGSMQIPYFNIIMQYVIVINVVLAIFNLIPIPPLDGSKILAGLLPGRQDWLDQLEAYGPILLIVLVFFGFRFISILINPVVNILILLANIVAQLVR